MYPQIQVELGSPQKPSKHATRGSVMFYVRDEAGAGKKTQGVIKHRETTAGGDSFPQQT